MLSFIIMEFRLQGLFTIKSNNSIIAWIIFLSKKENKSLFSY